MLTEKEINDRFEENRKLLGNFPLAINLIRYKEVFNQAILAISLQAELDRLKAERRWVPVSERLPEVRHDIFFQMYSGNIFAGWYDGKNFRSSHITSCPSYVLRYYEIPDAPKAGEL